VVYDARYSISAKMMLDRGHRLRLEAHRAAVLD
jgi:hypothetical protein